MHCDCVNRNCSAKLYCIFPLFWGFDFSKKIAHGNLYASLRKQTAKCITNKKRRMLFSNNLQIWIESIQTDGINAWNVVVKSKGICSHTNNEIIARRENMTNAVFHPSYLSPIPPAPKFLVFLSFRFSSNAEIGFLFFTILFLSQALHKFVNSGWFCLFVFYYYYLFSI